MMLTSSDLFSGDKLGFSTYKGIYSYFCAWLAQHKINSLQLSRPVLYCLLLVDKSHDDVTDTQLHRSLRHTALINGLCHGATNFCGLEIVFCFRASIGECHEFYVLHPYLPSPWKRHCETTVIHGKKLKCVVFGCMILDYSTKNTTYMGTHTSVHRVRN